MKISLIIPCYNEESFIGQCLESIRHQSRIPDEIIVCNNNSTDNSLKVIKSFQRLLPLKIITQKKKGIIPTIEKAWRNTTGDIVLRSDADNVLPPKWVEKLSNHLIKDKTLAACGGPAWATDGKQPYRFFWNVGQQIGYDLYNLKYNHTFLIGLNFAIRRQVLENINGYHHNLSYVVDDQLLVSKLVKFNYKFRHFNDCYCFTSCRHLTSFDGVIKAILELGFHFQFYQERALKPDGNYY